MSIHIPPLHHHPTISVHINCSLQDIALAKCTQDTQIISTHRAPVQSFNGRVLAKLYDFDAITEVDMDCDAKHVPELQEWMDRPGFHTFTKVSKFDDSSLMPSCSIENTLLTALFHIHRVQSMPKLSSPAMLI